MKYTCTISNLEFESEKQFKPEHLKSPVFGPRHPAIDAVRAKYNRSWAVGKAVETVSAGGEYTTIEEFIALVEAAVPTVEAEEKARFEAEQEARKAKDEARKVAEIERKAKAEAAKITEGLQPGASRQDRNAALNAHGYKWDKTEITGYFAGIGDEPEYVWALLDPDGNEISESQAVDEIKRGRDVVRAEVAAKQAKIEAEAKVKADAKAEREARFDASADAFDAQVVEIEQTCERLPRKLAEWPKHGDWPVIAKIEGATSSYRHSDTIRQGVVDGVTYYLVVTGTGFGDDGYWDMYRQIGDTQLWASGD